MYHQPPYAKSFTGMDLLVKKFSRLHCKDLLNTEVSSLQRFKQFVWVDETGSDDRNRRMKFGYSLRGEPPVCHHLLHCGRRISAIAAMSTDGVVTYDLVHGSVNGEKFIQFLQGKLVPEMLLYDGENPLSILVMDNSSIHNVQPVLDTPKQMGIIVLFLPPYSLDMNPIEEI